MVLVEQVTNCIETRGYNDSLLEKYLNSEGFFEFEKSLKIKSALKSTENHSKTLKSPWILLFSAGLITVEWEVNQYKIVVPLFGAATAAPNKGTTILL